MNREAVAIIISVPIIIVMKEVSMNLAASEIDISQHSQVGDIEDKPFRLAKKVSLSSIFDDTVKEDDI